MRTGLFGGTFDPIHLGHLIAAEEVRVRLSLDRVLFIPARQPWLKADKDITHPQARLAMVRLAIQSNPGFSVSEVEIERPGPTYTVDTIESMREAAQGNGDFFFIAGTDAVADMPRWKDPHRIVTLCRIIAVRRPGAESIDMESLTPHIPQAAQCMTIVDVPQIDISSTMIRDRVKSGLSIRYLVPSAVEAYIFEHGLYAS